MQSGIGRTGHWFASLAEGVRPDVITLAKGLGGGLPIGACIALGAAGDLFAPGDHGSTFGGNPVSCAAALAVLDTIADEHLLDDVKRVGEHLAHGWPRSTARWSPARAAAVSGGPRPHRRPRGRRRGGGTRARTTRQRGQARVMRLAPPLIVTEAEVDLAVPLLRRTRSRRSPDDPALHCATTT